MSSNIKLENLICSIKKTACIPDQKFIDSTIKRIESTMELFQKEYKDKRFELTFSNGEVVKFQINQDQLPHMLGINLKKLRKTSLYKRSSDESFDSYDYLNKIVNNPKALQTLNEHRSGTIINYYSVKQRCLSIENFYKLKEFSFVGVDFDKRKILNKKDQTLINSNKLLLFKSDINEISCYLMGLGYDSYAKENYVETIFPLYKDEPIAYYNPKRFIENQKILLPTKLETEYLYDDYNCVVKTIDECQSKEEVIHYLSNLKKKLNVENCEIDDTEYASIDSQAYSTLERVR